MPYAPPPESPSPDTAPPYTPPRSTAPPQNPPPDTRPPESHSPDTAPPYTPPHHTSPTLSFPPVNQRTLTRVDTLTAIVRHPVVFLIPVLILGALGGLWASKKPITYTAQSQLLVGAPAPGTAGELPGVVQAEQSLASIYAREIGFNSVVLPLSRRFHATPGNIASRLSASPLPDAPIIKVQATATSANEAVALANAAGARLASSLRRQTHGTNPGNNALSGYQQAATALAKARAHQQQLSQRLLLPANNPAVVAADAQVQEAELMANVLGNQYQNLFATRQNTPTVNLFQSATAASGNRTSNLEIYVFGGVVAGLLIGAALATLIANRRAILAGRQATAAVT